ncbi:MAG: type II secretion system F family protein [Acidobacteria bacterium]|nr:type II secretion system F family protein [Acidobacteriota bacterium]
MVLAVVLIFFFVVFIAVAVAVGAGSAALGGLSPNPAGSVSDEAGEGSLLIRTEELSSIGLWSSLLARFDFVDGLKSRLAQADLGWSVGRITLLMLLFGAVFSAVLLNWSWIPGWAAIAGGIGGTLLPYFYVSHRRRARFIKLSQQFPEALDSLTRAMRAGHPVATALDLLAEETPMPLAAELRRTVTEVRLGLPLEQALDNFSNRLPLLEVGIFSSALRLQVRTGGKLSEVMEKLAESMREAESLRSEVRAIAAHGRMTGIILTALPIFIAGTMATVNPGYLETLTNYEHGRDLIAGAVACLILAHFVIRRIVDIRI